MFAPLPLVPFIEDSVEEAGPGEYDAQAGRCPVDGTILSQAEIDIATDQPAVHLERCSSCRGVWFDAGEWSLLANHHLLENIEQIWTAEWRARQRRLRNEREYERRTREEFGPELFALLEAVAAKLKGYERRSQALAYLRETSD